MGGDGGNTEADSTHPGYDEKMNAMKINYIELEKNPPKQVKPVKRVKWFKHYIGGINLLTLTLKGRGSPALISVLTIMPI